MNQEEKDIAELVYGAKRIAATLLTIDESKVLEMQKRFEDLKGSVKAQNSELMALRETVKAERDEFARQKNDDLVAHGNAMALLRKEALALRKGHAYEMGTLSLEMDTAKNRHQASMDKMSREFHSATAESQAKLDSVEAALKKLKDRVAAA